MSNNISKVFNCANCGACMNICPKDAISLDKSGYFYKYSVDENKCISCGACVKVCPLQQTVPHLDLKNAYGGWHKDLEVVKSSSSGGAFHAIANYVLSLGGVVYGAAYSEDFREVYCRSTNETSLDNIKRSKYVESTVRYAFREIKSELDKGKYVLFCGTPCQAAGLARYLRKDYEKLFIVDFACGGLTSHKLYVEHLESLEKKYGSKVVSVNFRAGLYGWKQHAFRVDFENGKSYQIPSELDPFVYAFMYARTGNRENCAACKFRNNHYSDLIIADYWRWFEYSNLQNNDTGISLILTNSEKGERIVAAISDVMHLEQQDLRKAMYNCYIKAPVTDAFWEKRKKFWEMHDKNGLEKAAEAVGLTHGIKAMISKVRIKANVSK